MAYRPITGITVYNDQSGVMSPFGVCWLFSRGCGWSFGAVLFINLQDLIVREIKLIQFVIQGAFTKLMLMVIRNSEMQLTINHV